MPQRSNDITTPITEAHLRQIIRAYLNQEVRRLLSSDGALQLIVDQLVLDLNQAESDIADLQNDIPFVLAGDGVAFDVDGLTLNVIGSSSISVDTDVELILDDPSGLQIGGGGLSIKVGNEFFALDSTAGLVTPFWYDEWVASTIAALNGPTDRHFLIGGGEFNEANFSKNCRIFFPSISAGSTTFSITAGAVASGTAISFVANGSDNASGAGGGMTFKAGAGVGGNGGQFNFYAGDASGSSGAGGNAFLGGGDSTASGNNNGGAAFLDGGRPSGTGNSQATIRITTSAGSKTSMVDARNINGSLRLGFLGTTPIAMPTAYTITAAPAVARALDADGNGGAYGALTLANLNDLRGDVVSLAAVLRQLIRDLGTSAGYGLLTGTGY